MAAHQDEKNHYTFTKFVTADRPIFTFNGMWHPVLPAARAISNNITLGHNSSQLIITGSNQASKSTLLTGVADNLLLAHVWGIAAAEQAEYTPLRHIFANINVSDNLSDNKSLFRMETETWKALLTTFKQLQKGEFAFLATDEILNGTNHTDAVALAKTVLKEIARQPHVISMTSTHFFELTDLAKEMPHQFKNMKAVVKWDKTTGKKQYTYRFIDGDATMEEASVLDEVLEAAGFDKAFRDSAQEEKRKRR